MKINISKWARKRGYKSDTVLTYLRRKFKETGIGNREKRGYYVTDNYYDEERKMYCQKLSVLVDNKSDLYKALEKKYPKKVSELQKIKEILRDFNYDTKNVADTVFDICQRLEDVINNQEEYIEQRVKEIIEEQSIK